MRTSWPDERILRELASRNPQPAAMFVGIEHTPGAMDLLRTIVEDTVGSETAAAGAGGADDGTPLAGAASQRMHRRRRRLKGVRWRLLLGPVVAVVAVVAVIVPLSSSGGGISGPTVSRWHAALAFHPAGPGSTRSGSWQLLGALLSGQWQQNVHGPPGGQLTCATPRACYVMAGSYRSPAVDAPLLSESLYVSNDLGATWDVLPMPGGFAPTTGLSCWASAGCAVGGTLHGQPIFLSTSDGGSRWTMAPLAGVSGALLQIDCSSAQHCAAVSGPSWTEQAGGAPDAPPGESFTTTGDGGRSWHTEPLAPVDAVKGIACADTAHCLVVGNQWTATAKPFQEVDFVRATSNGGRSWTSGSLPAGFTLGPISHLSCANATRCFVTGMIPIPNGAHCGPTQGSVAPATDVTLPPMSPAVAALSKAEAALAAHAAATEARSGTFSCSTAELDQVSDIASTVDGGRTWTPDPLPADVPRPQLGSIACASPTRCWASGAEQVIERIGPNQYAGTPRLGPAINLGSPVLLGTTDGGRTWGKVDFAVPANAPDAYGQSYLAIGDISCPAANACMALGATAQGAPTAPVYSFVATPTAGSGTSQTS